MLKINHSDYGDAVEAMMEAWTEAEEAGLANRFSFCSIMLEALGRDFDVEAVDPGPDEDEACETHWCILAAGHLQPCWRGSEDDVASGEVWPYCSYCSSTLHTTTEHADSLLERFSAEVDAYNKGLMA
jgi:hypothetical protein